MLVLHDINQAARYSDHLIAMKDGQVLVQGSPAQVITEQLIPEIFGVSCVVIEDPVSKTPLCVPGTTLTSDSTG